MVCASRHYSINKTRTSFTPFNNFPNYYLRLEDYPKVGVGFCPAGISIVNLTYIILGKCLKPFFSSFLKNFLFLL